MPRWVIVDLSSNQLVSEYVSDKKEQGTDRFGGAWDDPSRSLHLQIPSELQSLKLSQIECVYEPNGQRIDACGCPMWAQEAIVNGLGAQVSVKAFDGSGAPIWKADGSQAELPAFAKVPVLGPVRKLRRKS